MKEVCVLAPAFVFAAALARALPLAFTLAFVCVLALVLSEVSDCALVTPGATVKPRFASALVFAVCVLTALSTPRVLTLALEFERSLAFVLELARTWAGCGLLVSSRAAPIEDMAA